ncbi:MAG: aldehyde dehydrogenase family protein [Betaproteobacteria bacterium]
MQIRDRLYVGGQWVASASSAVLTVVSPSTEEAIATIPAGTIEDADRAVRAARGAFDAWSTTPRATRAGFLQKIHDGLEARQGEIALDIATEVGMPLKMASRIQATLPVLSFGLYARLAAEFEFEERVGNSLVMREAVGVVAAITPWNYPLHQIAAKVAAALAAGCTVVLKPSEVAPLNAFILAEIVHDCGLPAGVFNLVTGLGPVVGEALVSHAEVDMVSFTGSTRAGRRVAELAGGAVKRVALELGGKSASVVLDDADMGVAIKSTLNSCFLNSGQTCNALTRLLVPDSRYGEATTIAITGASAFTTGDPLTDGGRMGPLVTAAQRERVRDYIRKGVAEGADLLAGGADMPPGLTKGWYVQPTVFGNVKPAMTIAQEEIFGPVLAIIPYESEKDAIRIANGTVYGLAAAVWSGDEARAQRVARRLRAGQVDVNGGQFNLNAPFGGFKQSGRGRELGRYGLEEFLEFRALQLRPDA